MLTDSIIDSAVRAALDEDAPWGDITAEAFIPAAARARAVLRPRQSGVLSGANVFARAFALTDESIEVELTAADGDSFSPGAVLATVTGPARSVLRAERIALNFCQRMSGIATMTRAFVEAAGPGVRIVDTRKTVPGLRAFDKHAVVCGGGHNHRFGLSDAVMVKDNHLAVLAGMRAGDSSPVGESTAAEELTGAREPSRAQPSTEALTTTNAQTVTSAQAVTNAHATPGPRATTQAPATTQAGTVSSATAETRMVTEAIRAARARLPHTTRIEVEVDRLEQIEPVLAGGADIIMLDNFGLADLRTGVELIAGRAIVEASGTVTLDTVADIAATGVDVISSGALTHSVRTVDLGLDLELGV